MEDSPMTTEQDPPHLQRRVSLFKHEPFSLSYFCTRFDLEQSHNGIEENLSWRAWRDSRTANTSSGTGGWQVDRYESINGFFDRELLGERFGGTGTERRKPYYEIQECRLVFPWASHPALIATLALENYEPLAWQKEDYPGSSMTLRHFETYSSDVFHDRDRLESSVQRQTIGCSEGDDLHGGAVGWKTSQGWNTRRNWGIDPFSGTRLSTLNPCSQASPHGQPSYTLLPDLRFRRSLLPSILLAALLIPSTAAVGTSHFEAGSGVTAGLLSMWKANITPSKDENVQLFYHALQATTILALIIYASYGTMRRSSELRQLFVLASLIFGVGLAAWYPGRRFETCLEGFVALGFFAMGLVFDNASSWWVGFWDLVERLRPRTRARQPELPV